ncbi:MAG: RNA-binding protein [Candidatus Methanomethylophilaceae archaeon]|nr:RNA-binding protein [Candidatus Methanomethylophilaceae archaeon]
MVMPLALLEKTIDKRVSLLLKDGRILEGKLTGYDEYMNMVLEETSERTVNDEERRLGTVVLRGNNVVSISLV